jgi:hypothetical protein
MSDHCKKLSLCVAVSKSEMELPDAVACRRYLTLLSGVCEQKKRKRKQNSIATRQTNVDPNKHYNHRPSSTVSHNDINAPSHNQTKTRAATMPKARADKAVMTVSRPAIPV